MKTPGGSILVLGSGPIRIGQAAEFDYSGSQACRALREMGYHVILLNSNPATIQTDTAMADVVYIRPLEAEVVERILTTHRPSGVIATLGGQVALNLCVELHRRGLWERFGVEVLGTSPRSVQRSEGREDFRQAMLGISEPVIESIYVDNIESALQFASVSSFPFIIRPDYTLGGTGGGVAFDPDSLTERVTEGLRLSPVSRVLVERYLQGWREIELEVIRDGAGNRLCVCGMENVDPMGIHTGDSIVVAPVLTLSDGQWQRLRSAAFRIVDELEIMGACNVQFALSPDAGEYAVIEVNPRASRSSALASKATGYPIARVAARIAAGSLLTEMTNPVTGVGSALSEPALDYVVVKFPRWPFEKFPGAENRVGTRMKSTGEVMALGRTFIEALSKAVRSLDLPGGIVDPRMALATIEELEEDLSVPTHRRLWSIFELLGRGFPPQDISARSGIHPFFIDQLARIVSVLGELKGREPDETLLRKAKSMGLSDRDIASASGSDWRRIRDARLSLGIERGYREVDGSAGETPAGSGYYYGTCGASDDGIRHDSRETYAVLGSGPIRIGQGVEFDYCCVKAVEALRRMGKKAVMINNNPETVSTDHDMSDSLYFEPLSEEDVLPVLKRENVQGVFASFGGQTSLKAGLALEGEGVRILGSPSGVVRATEDRGHFSGLLERLGILQPLGCSVKSVDDGLGKASMIGYPVMVRPSFVIGGLAMKVVNSPSELASVLEIALQTDEDQSVLIDRFLPGAEFEVDVLCDGREIVIPGIFEHLDPAGVHSGDSVAIFPDVSLSQAGRRKIEDISRKIAVELGVKGLLNIQFVLSGDEFYVIEANPRASRTVPIAVKLSGIPLVEMAVRAALGESLSDMGLKPGLCERIPLFGVKVPVFSTEKLPGVDALPGPAMQSTGEALGVGDTVAVALYEGLRGAGWRVPEKGRLLLSVADRSKLEAPHVAAAFHALGWSVDATSGTADVLRNWGIPCRKVEKGKPLISGIASRQWDLIVNVASGSPEVLRDGYQMRRSAIEASIPCVNDLHVASALAVSISLRIRGTHP